MSDPADFDENEMMADGRPKMRPYLRDLARRLMHVASPHVDQGDVDRLQEIAKDLDDLVEEVFR